MTFVSRVALNLRRHRSLMPPCLFERDQPLARLVPQHQSNAPQALPHGQAADVPQLRVVAHDGPKSVEWDAARQMVHVVDPDVGGEPAQHTGST